MPWLKAALNRAIAALTTTITRPHMEQMAKVPLQGPLIVVANHINALEAPLVLARAYPRPIKTFAKIEHWHNPVMVWFIKLWGGIPVARGEADVSAFRAGLAALDAGDILIVLPEGTRSRHGRLQRGHPGVAVFALRSDAPVLPVAYYGNEHFKTNLKRLRRTDFYMEVGNPFHVAAGDRRITSPVRQQIADEIMYQIAALLPPPYRGEYADLDAATEEYLRFAEETPSNLGEIDGRQRGEAG